MPIAASFPLLQADIQNALNLDIAGNPQLISVLITTSTASALSMGLFQLAPPPAPPIPPPPAGFSAMQSQLEAAFNLDIAGNPDLVATMFASGVSVMSPVVPPTGFSLLQSEASNAFNLDIAGNPQLISTMLANGIVNYYLSGMVF